MVRQLMKVKNMKQEIQGTYSKLYAQSKKNVTTALLVGGIALVLALIASLFKSPVLICIFSILSLILSGGEIVSKRIKTLSKVKVDDTLLILIAVLIPFFLGRFFVSALAMALYRIFSLLIFYASGRLGVLLNDAADVLPRDANVLDDDMNIRRVPAESVLCGTKIIVKTGETVPVDAIILDGFTDFDTSNVCRGTSAMSLSSGDKILAGYINTGAAVTCEAVTDYSESLVMDMARLASLSETGNTKGEKRFKTIAKWYPVAVLGVAILMLLIGGLTSGLWASCMLRVSVLLIVATTGSYIASVPLLSSVAVWNLKKKGLSLSSGDMIDEIADINCVIFEKNGILTDGEYNIKDIYTSEDISEEDFLMIAANCIGGKPHPISRILTKYMNPYIPAENVMEFPGKGSECTIMGKTFLCGTENFMKECDVDISEAPGYSLYVSIDGVLMGAMLLQDALRLNNAELTQELRETGVEKIVMFSSERKEAAELAFKDSGADEYFAELSANERGETVKRIKQNDEEMTCLYIGDTVNGEQALDAADIGFTLVRKDDKGLEYAKAFLLSNLETVADAIELSRLTCGKIELHFYCASAIKIILGFLALFGAINIAAAIFVEAILSILAIYSARDLLKK